MMVGLPAQMKASQQTFLPPPLLAEQEGGEVFLIDEDFTVWRDSERCSSVLLGIYLGESLGESC